MTVTGEHLAATTSVQFNGVEASFKAGFSGTQLVATVPLDATIGPITVITPYGTNTTGTNFIVTGLAAPAITSFSPQSGLAGTPVAIEGLNLSETTSVAFNGVPAQFTVFGNNLIAYVPQGANTGPITVVTPGGSTTSANPFQVNGAAAQPVISSVTPGRGQPGTTVVISGQHLDSATSVRFNGLAAEFSLFGFSIFATVPATASTGLITVETPAGTAQSPAAFEVIDPLAPVIAAFNPTAGGVGTPVSITGTNLLNTTAVLFGGVAAAFTPVSDFALRATVPEGAVTGPITVNSPAGLANSSDPFYVAAQILSFEPASGPVGTTVKIQGRNFQGVSTVLFGSVSASFTNLSPTEIQTTVPEGATSGLISIATPAGFVQTHANFLLPPKITSFNPPSGPVAGEVTIFGENLLETSSVQIGGVQAPFAPAALTSVVATIPAGASGGFITVITPAGSATSAQPFFVGLFSDLGLAATVDPEAVSVGDFLSYTLQIGNRGPLDATDVVLQDQLPDGVRLIFPPSGAEPITNNLITWRLGVIPAGGSLNFRVSVEVTGNPPLTNTVHLTSTSADPNPADNDARLITRLKGAPADVTLSVAPSAGRQVKLSWPATADGFLLESSSALGPTALWTAVTNAPVVESGHATVLIDSSSGTSFFHLKKPSP